MSKKLKDIVQLLTENLTNNYSQVQKLPKL